MPNRLASRQTDAQRQTLQQVVDVLQRQTGLEPAESPIGGGYRFTRASNSEAGLLAAEATLAGEQIVADLQLAQVSSESQVLLAPVWERLAALSRARVALADGGDGAATLSCNLVVDAAPMSMGRLSAFEAEVQRVVELAKSIQQALPSPAGTDFDKLYKGVSEFLRRVRPLPSSGDQALQLFARETAGLFDAGLSVALLAKELIEAHCALAAVAAALEDSGRSIGRFTHAAAHAVMIPGIAQRAPGVVAFSADQIAIGANAYQIGEEMRATLRRLAEQRTPIALVGDFEGLERVLSTGQGLAVDPLAPVVQKVPPLGLGDLTRYAALACAPEGGLTRAAEEQISRRILEEVEGLSPAESRRLLSPVAHRVVAEWQRGRPSADSTPWVRSLSSRKTTIGGFSSAERAVRATELQTLLNALAAPEDAVDFMRSSLIGQDLALDELGRRIRKEILTRPQEQPLRWLAQGPPAVGKSESLKLLAKQLGLRYEFIDAASFSDHHAAATQLLGAATGLVGSNRPGRLERAAKHQPGVVLEIADLDHCPSHVRSSVADIFLKALDEGLADSASGATFSTANLILVFTMNLPDERRLREGAGFAQAPDRSDAALRTANALTEVFSPAFVDRVGAPIVFQPLASEALAVIAEQQAVEAFTVAAERLALPVEATPSSDFGRHIIAGFRRTSNNPGARGLKEYVRELVAECAARLAQTGAPRSVVLAVDSAGNVSIQHQ